MQHIKLCILFKYHRSECNNGRNMSVKCYIFCCSGHNHGAIMTLQVLLMDTWCLFYLKMHTCIMMNSCIL